mmetsp:Transcript_2129/g.6781  ORF Transcript_2129/g.6781 Transcript_2129/m.6781 type:complete len:217 (+) Transcript_2129:323-973(+)
MSKASASVAGGDGEANTCNSGVEKTPPSESGVRKISRMDRCCPWKTEAAKMNLARKAANPFLVVSPRGGVREVTRPVLASCCGNFARPNRDRGSTREALAMASAQAWMAGMNSTAPAPHQGAGHWGRPPAGSSQATVSESGAAATWHAKSRSAALKAPRSVTLYTPVPKTEPSLPIILAAVSTSRSTQLKVLGARALCNREALGNTFCIAAATVPA